MDAAAADAGNPAIVLRGLMRRFGSLVAVDAVDLAIAAGTIHGLLGTNGAGKTTVIKMLATLLPPTAGTATVAGYDIRRQPFEVRRHIGYVSQMLSADGELTGWENLLIAAKLYRIPRAERAPRMRQALRFMGLEGDADRLVGRYSGGMVRRLEIAQAMLHRPPVLFLDEPTVGLDPTARHEVWQRIRALRDDAGATILLTTHDMDEAGQLCEGLAFMHRGRLVAEGTPAALRRALGEGASSKAARCAAALAQAGAVAEADIRKLRHDPWELLVRMAQPVASLHRTMLRSQRDALRHRGDGPCHHLHLEIAAVVAEGAGLVVHGQQQLARGARDEADLAADEEWEIGPDPGHQRADVQCLVGILRRGVPAIAFRTVVGDDGFDALAAVRPQPAARHADEPVGDHDDARGRPGPVRLHGQALVRHLGRAVRGQRGVAHTPGRRTGRGRA
jgi:ABC-2 type transport system ATP-binding protein